MSFADLILTPEGSHPDVARAAALTVADLSARLNASAEDTVDVLAALGLIGTSPLAPTGVRDGFGRLRSARCKAGLHTASPSGGACLQCVTSQAQPPHPDPAEPSATATAPARVPANLPMVPFTPGMCQAGVHPKPKPGRCKECKNARERERHAARRAKTEGEAA